MSVQTALSQAVEMERLTEHGLALGLSVDEVARLESAAMRRARAEDIPLATAMRQELADVCAGAPAPSPSELVVDQVELLHTHVRRIWRVILLGPIERMAQWIHREDRS